MKIISVIVSKIARGLAVGLVALASATALGQQVGTLNGSSLDAQTIDLADGNSIYLFNSAKPTGTYTHAAVNAGDVSSDFLASDGFEYRPEWIEALVFTGNTRPARYAGRAISNTEDDALYQTQRWGDFVYEIPARDGYYDIVLKTSENHFIRSGSEGKRVFSIEVEGEVVISDLDLYKEVGPLTAYDVTVRGVYVEDGSITIRGFASANNAVLSAIYVQGRF